MRITSHFSTLAILLSLINVAGASPTNERPFGIDKRVPWTTSRVKGTPDPPAPYRTRRAFTNLKFEEPLDISNAPDSNRLFVVERYGKIYSFVNEPNVKKADVFLDLGRVLYGVAFHPRFAENGYVYVTYVLDAKNPGPRGTRVSRVVATRDDPPRCDPKSEKILIEWLSGGHNGGCLKFGPDGYLYISTGDAGEIADPFLLGQDISELPGSVLRIDIDKTEGELPYAIPKDNPFVDTEGARGEIWAYGLRQLWKMSFDRKTGELWGGNVGQDLWEMIYIIKNGGNYGWSVMEGSYPFRPERPRGPTPIELPIVEHNHTEARSVTGGYVYYGSRLKELSGAYIYGDYDTGKIWSLRYDGSNVTEHQELVDSTLRLVALAEDNSGELFLLDHMSGMIHELAPNTATQGGENFPRKLSETGLFSSVESLTPAPGLIPYSVSSPAWADDAIAERYLALPGKSQIELATLLYPQPSPGAPPGWKFPDGTVLVQTLSLEMEKGNPASRRRLETRIMHHERLVGTEEVGDQVWQGYTYVWNDEQTEAELLESTEGMDRTLTISDSSAPGGKRQQTWHVPSRTECTVCHNMAAKYALGTTTLQLNSNHDYGGVVDNQLRTLEHLGVFTKPLPKRPDQLPRLASHNDESKPLGERARAYLHSNCAHCHRKWGGGNAEFLLLATVDLADMGTVGVRPGQGTFHIVDASVIEAGDPYRSVLYHRMSTAGGARMPRLGSNVTDNQGLALVHDWIASLSKKTGVGTQSDVVRGQSAQNIAALDWLEKSPTATVGERQREIDRLLASTSGALRLSHAIDAGSISDSLQQLAIARGTRHAEAHVRDLFERHLPEEKRTKRLGSVVDPAKILALVGDAASGRKLFFETESVQCKNCHQIQGKGNNVGPDLSEVGKKYKTRGEILETILEPSKKIEEKFLTYLLQTNTGEIHSGLLVKETKDEVVMKDAQGKEIKVAADTVALLLPQQQSLMPELLLRDMTTRQVADLVEFLVSLK